jgi:DNA-binding MarR family transcriptional regulator
MQKSLLTNIGWHADGIDFAALSQLLAMDRSTLTRNLTHLEDAGYVRVVRDERDGRKRVVSLTDSGRATVAASDPLWRDAQRRVVDALGYERAVEMTAVLASVERIVRELD